MYMKNKSTMAGMVLAGLATGAAAWYLFGTSSGKDVCSKLVDSVKNMSNTVADKASHLTQNISGKAGDVSDRVMA